MATQITTETYSSILTRGTDQVIQNTNVEEGKLRVATDSKRLFFDLNSTRLEITDVVWDYTEAQLTANLVGETPILNNSNKRKMFIASDSGKVFVCDNSGAQIALKPLTSFKVDAATMADSATSATSATYATSAGSADSATSATNATSATYAESAGSATSATNATSASYATSADTAESATSATSATYATSSDSATSATNATSATYATSSDVSTSSTYAASATADASGNTIGTHYAPLDSPVFTGTPETVTPSTGDNSTRVASTAFVQDAITTAIGSVAGISISIVTELPETGQPNVFYLIRNASQTGTNLYDEYIWVASTSSFESLGPISIDMTGYINTVSTSGSGNAVTGYTVSGSTVTFEKNSTFLTEHPDIIVTANTTSTAAPTPGSTFTAIDEITKDSDGHVTTYNTKTVTIPETATSATYASSANTATNATSATYATSAGDATNAASATYATSADSATSATSATNATSATYATSADSATSATNATSATYATSADTASTATQATSATYATSATSASTATDASFIVEGSTANRIPYYGCGATTASAASTATADTFNLDFGDIDSVDYYF